MKKIISIFIFFIIFQSSGYAYKLEQVDGSPDSRPQFNIVADVTDNIYYGVQVRLDIVDGEVINYTQGNLLGIGACGENKFIKDQKICVDVVKDSPIETNDNLGSFEVNWNIGANNKSIMVGDGGAYFDESVRKDLNNDVLYQFTESKKSNVEIIILILILVLAIFYINNLYSDSSKRNRSLKKIVCLALILLLPSSIFIEKFNQYIIPEFNQLPQTGLSTTTFTKKVLVVVYNPTMSNGKKLNANRGWKDPNTLTSDVKAWFSNTSSGRVNYQITYLNINDFTPLEGNQKYTQSTYESCLANSANCKHTGTSDWLDFDYKKFFADNQICSKANSGSIDEVWIWGGPYFGFFESTLLGPQSKLFFYNSSGFADAACSKLVPVMGLNYERDYDQAIHSFSHRAEFSMDKLYGGRNTTNPATNWDKFAYKLNGGNPSLMNGAYGCGEIHWAPNANIAYDGASKTMIKSYCDSFFNYPNITSSSNLQNINSTAWGSTHLGFLTYWFKHIPNKSGCGPDKKTNDWWKVVMDPNELFNSANTNCIPSATSTNTPIITKTLTPTPTKTKVPTPTNTHTPINTKTPIVTTVKATNTSIPTKTKTPVPTNTPIKTVKPTNTKIPIITTIKATKTLTPTVTNTINPSTTLTVTLTNTPTIDKTLAAISYTPTIIPTIDLEPIDCGPIDSNNDAKLNLFDFIPFSRVYRKKCKDNYPSTGCGAKDTNANGEIDIMDFIYFSKHYYTRAGSCTLITDDM